MNQIPKEFNPGITSPAYFIRKKLLQSFIEFAPYMKGIMLDFGCGSKPYKTLFSVEKYIGLDYENPGHSHINEQIDVFYNGKDIPFEDEYFDSIFSSEVFEHIFNLDKSLKELNRVLKYNGTMLISCPFSICEHEEPHDFARYSSFGIKHLLTNAGFEIIAQRKTGNSIEAIHQLKAIYINRHLYPYLKKIPVIRSVFRITLVSLVNITGIFLSKIFPNRNDLYLNNIVVCKKIKVI
ncbi:MAG: class I SAM-dependent methyltransferase [Chitinophagaceae bacterium]|nr:class I SAM-dependent methyltransferase [Chitinophagaceae bacterium]MCW5905302.1 class I SAM-dependent methyltransferase [Chitinophagaceae bacterium]